MKALVAVLALLLLAGCGEAPAPDQRHADAPAPVQPLAKSGNLVSSIKPAPPPTPPRATPEEASKPVVSRETPMTEPTPATPIEPDSYRALGTEPFWAATVKGGYATIETPSGDPRSFVVRRQDDAQSIRFSGEGFAMTITPGPCSDGMSNAFWSDRVQIAFADGVFKGCGGQREDMEEPPPDDN